MWAFPSKLLSTSNGTRFMPSIDGQAATFAEVIAGWREDPAFRAAFNALLANTPYSAFRWESPAITKATISRPFEFVVLNSSGLVRRPDPEAFAEHFRGASIAEVVEFANLGGDAVMVVPCPIGLPSAYGHLAAFVREAPESQQQALWKCVGEAMARRISAKPVWLSTAGAGVSWLHVRLDDRPKYYAMILIGSGPNAAMNLTRSRGRFKVLAR